MLTLSADLSALLIAIGPIIAGATIIGMIRMATVQPCRWVKGAR